MVVDKEFSLAALTRLIRQCLEDGCPVDIDGLGRFAFDGEGRIDFVPETRPKVFIAYVEEDLPSAEKLCDGLEQAGFDAWLDRKRLLPGQNWPRAIERAIEVSDFVIGLFSRHGVSKRGHFHSELRFALDCAGRLPLEEVFLIPVRLDGCQVPPQVARNIHYVDLFPAWEDGLRRIMAVMRKALKNRQRRVA